MHRFANMYGAFDVVLYFVIIQLFWLLINLLLILSYLILSYLILSYLILSKCCMHAHHVAPRAPPSRGKLYRRKTFFLDDFPIFFIQMRPGPTHALKCCVGFWNVFNFAKPLKYTLPPNGSPASLSVAMAFSRKRLKACDL